jgi:hypothetical protein
LAARGALRTLLPGRYDGFFESYKSEVAAYKLDRLLDLDMVPPAVERRYNGAPVSLQLFAEDAKMLKEVNEQKLHAPTLQSGTTSCIGRTCSTTWWPISTRTKAT